MSQLDRIYLDSLIQYNHHLKQRNSLLRTFSERGKVDTVLIAGYDFKLAEAGNHIHKGRREFIEKFKPIFSKHYDFCLANLKKK